MCGVEHFLIKNVLSAVTVGAVLGNVLLRTKHSHVTILDMAAVNPGLLIIFQDIMTNISARL